MKDQRKMMDYSDLATLLANAASMASSLAAGLRDVPADPPFRASIVHALPDVIACLTRALGNAQHALNQLTYRDGEVIGQDEDGRLICWGSDLGGCSGPYNCGDTLEQYGVNNLTPEEKARLGL